MILVAAVSAAHVNWLLYVNPANEPFAINAEW